MEIILINFVYSFLYETINSIFISCFRIIDFYSLFIGVLSSLLASFVFWFAMFKYSRTNVKFSIAIRRITYADAVNNKNRYAIKFANYGKRNLNEVYIKARLYIKDYDSFTYLTVGGDNTLHILSGDYKRKKKEMNLLESFYHYDWMELH